MTSCRFDTTSKNNKRIEQKTNGEGSAVEVYLITLMSGI